MNKPFAETHPSLKNSPDWIERDTDRYYEESRVQKHTTDNAVLRAALEKLKKMDWYDFRSVDDKNIIESIYKELGLDQDGDA